MDLIEYKKRREALQEEKPKYRNLCLECRQPEFGCYCEHIQTFDPGLKFAILIHPIEVKRRIATGRMSYLTLKNSELIEGQNYSDNKRVNELIEDPKYQPMVLYPGKSASNLSEMSGEQKSAIFKEEKTPLVFVVDGTWATAKKTMHLSQNLKTLPRVCFTPSQQSQFRVRKQPGVNCYSTLEAIHHFIDLLGDRENFLVKNREHDRLIHVFNKMVERQLEFVRESFLNPREHSYRRPKRLIAG